MTTRDISGLAATDLLALRAEVDERLEAIKQRHVEEATALGLTIVNGDGKRQRKRRVSTHKETE